MSAQHFTRAVGSAYGVIWHFQPAPDAPYVWEVVRFVGAGNIPVGTFDRAEDALLTYRNVVLPEHERVDYIVARHYGTTVDYLIGWDVMWGPCWSLAKKRAMPFPSLEQTVRAREAALAIMKPVPYRVPDFGANSRLTIQFAEARS